MALKGVKVLELAGLAPGPYCGLILADFGADVVRIDRTSGGASGLRDPLARGKRSIALNLKLEEGREVLRRLARDADVLIEPYRPGVMEKLGLGPDDMLEVNPRLIYARLTGWGQTGPYKRMAGHDINYIAISGALNMISGGAGRGDGRPHPPINMLGDFAGGGMLCAMGVLLALIERGSSNKGQVVDSAMVDGAAHLSSFIWGFRDMGAWREPPGTNLLDGGAPFYDTYACMEDTAGAHKGERGYMAVGAIEPQFFAELIEGLGLSDDDACGSQMDRESWPAMRERLAEVFASKTRQEWEAVFDGTDACCTPVLRMDEVAAHPANRERELMAPLLTNAEAPEDGQGASLYPRPAPRLSRTPGDGVGAEPHVGQHTKIVLQDCGFSTEEVETLEANGAIKCHAQSKL